MTVVTAGPAGVDMSGLDLSVILGGTAVTETPTTYTVDLGQGDEFTASGSGFTYDNSGYLTGGTVTGLSDAYLGSNSFQISGFSEPATTLVSWAQNGQGALALQTIFAGNDSISGGGAADTLDGGAGDNTVLGAAGDDSITVATSAGSNYLRGGDGNDVIHGGTGYDNVNGNTGDDTLIGQSKVGDWLLGGQGNDFIDATASTGHNIINGNLGNDTIHGGTGGDTLRGGQGDDMIVGGSGNDWITGDLGHDTLTGGGGADTFHASAGVETITDFNTAHGDVVQLDHGVTATTGQSGADVHLMLSNGGEVILSNVQLTSLPSGWTVSVCGRRRRNDAASLPSGWIVSL